MHETHILFPEDSSLKQLHNSAKKAFEQIWPLVQKKIAYDSSNPMIYLSLDIPGYKNCTLDWRSKDPEHKENLYIRFTPEDDSTTRICITLPLNNPKEFGATISRPEAPRARYTRAPDVEPIIVEKGQFVTSNPAKAATEWTRQLEEIMNGIVLSAAAAGTALEKTMGKIAGDTKHRAIEKLS